MATRFWSDYANTRLSAIWSANELELKNKIASTNWEYDDPSLRRKTLISAEQMDLNEDLTKQFYANSDNPNDAVERDQFAQLLHNLNPSVSKEFYLENMDESIYRATGFKSDAKGAWENIQNTFTSSGASLMAGMQTYGTYLASALLDSTPEQRAERMERLNESLSNKRLTYRGDIYDHNLITDFATEAARALPSMIPALGISGIVALSSVMTGGTATAPLSLGMLKFLRTASTLNRTAKIGFAAYSGARMLTTSLMEAGGTALELHNNGFSPEVILPVSTAVGVANGTLEILFGDGAERVISKPITSAINYFGKNTVNDAMNFSMKKMFKDMGKEYLISLGSEPSTEVVQELSSMLGFNYAVHLQNKAGKPLKDVIGYSVEDMTEAVKDTAISTLKGQIVLGLGSSAITTLGSTAFGNIRKALSIDSRVTMEGATGMASNRNIKTIGPVADKIKEGEVIKPIPVVKIGDSYVTYNATPDQNNIARNSKSFYIQEVPFEADTRSVADSGVTAKRNTVERVLRLGLEKGRLSGFTYLDNDMNKVEDIISATKIAIQPDGDSSSVIVGLDDNSSSLQSDVEIGVWGSVLSRRMTDEEINERLDALRKAGKKQDKKEDTQQKKDVNTTASNENDAQTATSEIVDSANATESATTQSADQNNVADIQVQQDSSDVNQETQEAEQSNADTADQADTEDKAIPTDEEVLEKNEGLKSAIEESRKNEEALKELEDLASEPIEIDAVDAQESQDSHPVATEEQNNADTAESALQDNDANNNSSQESTAETVNNKEDNKESDNKPASQRLRREQFRRKKSFDDALESLGATRDEIEDAYNAVEELTELFKATELEKTTKKKGSRASARAGAVSMMGFAHAQGRTFKDFYNEIKFGSTEEITGVEGGSYDTLTRVVTLTSKATPSTLAHEVSHHFLATLPDGEVKNNILNVYKDEFTKDGNKIGKNLQEAFAYDFEQYIYFNNTDNDFLRKIFSELKNVCKTIWNFFTNKDELSPEKIAMFDSIFGKVENQELSNAVTEGIQTIVDSVVESKDESVLATQIDNQVQEIVEENTQDDSASDSSETLQDDTEQPVETNAPETAEETPVKEKPKKINTKSYTEMKGLTQKLKMPKWTIYKKDEGGLYAVNKSLNTEIDLNTESITTRDPLLKQKMADIRSNLQKVEKDMAPETEERNEANIENAKENTQKVIDETIQSAMDVNEPETSYTTTNTPQEDINEIEENLNKAGEDLRAIDNISKGIPESEPEGARADVAEVNFLKIASNKLQKYAKGIPTIPDNGFETMRSEVAKGNTLLSEDFLFTEDDIVQIKEPKLYKAIENLSKSIDPSMWAFYFERLAGNVIALNVSTNDVIAIPSTLDNGSLNSNMEEYATPLSILYYDNLSDTAYDKIFEFDEDGNEIVKYDFLGKAKPNYDYRILAQAFISNLSDQMKRRGSNGILYQTVDQRNTASDFAAFMIDTVLSDKIDKILKGYAESGEANMAEYIRKNTDVLSELEGIEDDAKNAIIDEIASQLSMKSEGYISYARLFSDALNDSSKMKDAINVMTMLVRTIINRMDKPARFWDLALKYFKPTDLSDSRQSDIYEAYKIFKNVIRGTGKLDNSTFRTLLSAIVDKNGNILNIEETSKYGYRSFLTDIVDGYMYSKELGDAKSDSVINNSDSRRKNQNILANEIKGTASERFGDDMYMLMTEIAHSNIEGAFANLYDGYVNGSIAEAISGIYKDNIKKLQDSLKDYARRSDKIEELKKKYKEAIKDYKQFYKDHAQEINSLNEINSKLDKKDEKIRKLKEQTSSYKERISKLQKMISDVREETNKIKKLLSYLTEEEKKNIAEEMEEQYRETIRNFKKSARRGDDRWYIMLAKVVNSINKNKMAKKKMDASPFIVQWKDYEPFMERLIGVLFNYGILKKDSINNLAYGRGLKALTNEELSNLIKDVDLITDSVRNMNDEKREQKRKDRKFFEEGIIADLKLFRGNYTDSEWNSFIAAYKDSFFRGSIEDNQARSGKLNRTLSQFIQMSNSMKSLSPALHAYFFGGKINGRIVTDNLNSATNKMELNSQRRINAFYNAGAKAFGLDEKNFKKSMNRLFEGKTFVMDSIDAVDFQDRTGINLLEDHDGTSYEAVANYVQALEKERQRANEVYNKKLEQLDENGIPGSTEYIMTKDSITIEHALKIANIDRKMNGIDGHPSYTMNDAMGIYIYSKQIHGLRGLIGDDSNTMNNNLSVNQILYVIDQFNNNPEYKPYRELADFMIRDMSSRHSDIADVYFNVTGRVLPRISNYFIIRRDLIGDSESIMPVWNEMGFPDDALKVSNKSTKARTNSIDALILGVTSSYVSSIKECERYIAFRELMDNYEHLLASDSDFRVAFQAVADEKGLDGIDILNRYWKQLRIIGKGTDTRPDQINSIMSKYRNNFSRAVLFGSISALSNAFMSLPITSTVAGARHTFKATMNYIGNKRNMDEFVYDKSEQMRSRARLDLDEIRRNVGYGNATKILSNIIGEDRAMAMTDHVRDWLDFWFDLMQKADTMIANITWLAIYNKKMEEYKGDITEDVETMICEQATQETLDIMPSQNAKDNALAYANPDNLIKQMILFTAQTNKQFNILWSGVKDITKHSGLKHLKDWQWENAKYLAGDVAAIGLATVGIALLSGEGLPDDDDDNIWVSMISGTAKESLTMIPIVGSTLRDIASGNAYADTGIAGATVNLIKTLSKKSSDRKEYQLGNAIQRMAMYGGQMFGLPYNIIYKPWQIYKNDWNLGYIMNANWGNFFEEVI